MKKITLLLVALLCCSLLLTPTARTDEGTVNIFVYAASLSGVHCNPNQRALWIIKSGGSAGVYRCSATNTFTLVGSTTTPGGSSGDIQYNNAGAFGGKSLSTLKSDLALNLVDNTSDASKPVSTAQQTALDLKQNLLTNSAGLRGALSDESGTGAALFGTSPSITTGLNDSNGNSMLLFTATGSAVNQLTLANGASSTGPTLSATGSGSTLDITLTPKGTGAVIVSNNLTLNNGTFAVSNGSSVKLNLSNTAFRVASDSTVGWSSNTNASAAGADTGLKRVAAGVVGASNGSTGGGALQATGASGQPTCDSTSRGAMWTVQSAAGVGDIFQVCMKGTADTYAWRSVFTAP
jgi:hypothetical protein